MELFCNLRRKSAFLVLGLSGSSRSFPAAPKCRAMRTFTPLQLKLIRHKLDLQQAVPTPQDLNLNRTLEALPVL